MYCRENISNYMDIDERIRAILESAPELFTDEEVKSIADCDNEIRICSVCGDIMMEGYYCEGDGTYYCSDECMEKDGISYREYRLYYYDIHTPELAEAVKYMPENKFNELIKEYGHDDGGCFYWTQWDCDPDLFIRLEEAQECMRSV